MSVWLTGTALAGSITLRPNTPLVGQSGLLMTSHIGQRAYQGTPTPIAIAGEEKDREALTAQALLLYFPKYTKFAPNTLPLPLTRLGAPTNKVPPGKSPAPLFIVWEGRLLKVGDATARLLGLPAQGTRRKTRTLPSGLFIAHERATKDYAKGVRFDTVLGRAYQNGLVLFRTNMYALNERFWAANKVTVTLPRPMQRLGIDGTLGPIITRLDLGGYEGAILLNAE